ncbi:MAG: helix-turn-helix domain-containing protein [Actinomycetota bacterium]|nr:helix-turn-helix domain-containing protein [Actinomycetota bacterium]MDP2287605.1 helix-turn-helix domain-containing protein [Actinomycetota bacterium]
MILVGPAPVRHDISSEALSPARSRILESLQQALEPVSASELAANLGQHANTVREHLEALVQRQLATRFRSDPDGRGRPAWRYSPSTVLQEPDSRVREYAGLALVLAEQLARSSADPEVESIAAGQAWGRMLTQEAVRGKALSARRQTIALMTEIGFDPETDSRMSTVLLRRCPFLDVARKQSSIVCSAHLGMIATAFEAFGGDSEGVQLVPFDSSSGCVLRFARSAGKQ